MADKVFADGFSFKRRDNAPEFVIGNLSIKVEDAIPFLKGNARNGWVNLNVLTTILVNLMWSWIHLYQSHRTQKRNKLQSRKLKLKIYHFSVWCVGGGVVSLTLFLCWKC